MEKILSIPPGLPRLNPTKSYWQTPEDEIANERTTEGLPGSVDIVIIGSGISGATIAYNLLSAQPNLQILMLEARQAASGASGRNGGHTKHASYKSFGDNIDQSGLDDAIKIAKLETDCMDAVHNFYKDNDINCDGHRCHTVDIYYDKDQWDQAHQLVDSMRQHLGRGNPYTNYQFYNPEETAQKFLTPNTYGSVRYPAGSLSAYKFTIGVLKQAISKGLNLQTSTPALSIQKTQLNTNIWTVETPRGQISAPRLVLATNGYTAHLYPALQGMIIPFRGAVTAHRPGSSMPQTGLATTYSFGYTDGFDYMITRQDGDEHAGDIVIGGGLTKAADDGFGEYGNTDDTTVDPAVERYLVQSTQTFFAQNWGEDHEHGRVRMCWSGIMAYSADGYPLVGEVPGEQGLWIDASFQGHGMVLCFLCARAVSEMMLGMDGDELDKWFPKCYRVTEERVKMKFKGMHHAPDVAEGGLQTMEKK